MATSRFSRAAVRSRTITGTTTVGGSSSTTVGIYPDGTVRFNDRNGVTQVVPANVVYTTANHNVDQPSSDVTAGDDDDALFRLIDALIARA